MPRFRVWCHVDAFATVDVEADSIKEAIDKATKSSAWSDPEGEQYGECYFARNLDTGEDFEL